MQFEEVVAGLQFPEGPIAMPDGSVLLVEIARGTLSRVWNGKIEVVAALGDGPNGAALGPDGAVYVCNNGGFEWHDINGLRYPGWRSRSYTTGRIERVNLATGRFERVYESCKNDPLRGPNDLVFDRTGGFWFTDLGKHHAKGRDHSALYYAKADGSLLQRAVYPALSFNGVGLSPDERTLYCNDTDSGRLRAFQLESPGKVVPFVRGQTRGKVVGVVPGDGLLDSLAVEADGRVCSATLIDGGITVFAPDGSREHVSFPDRLTTNICFGGADVQDAYITLSSTGRLIKARWPRPGLKLNFAAP